MANRNILPARSYAFRSKHSTSQCINDLINNIYLYKKRGLHIVACIDIEKTYDRTDYELLCQKLEEIGINAHIVQWLRLYLSDRTLVLGKSKVKTNRGLAQGSTLSPILFNIFTVDLHDIASELCLVYQFADDFFIVCMGKDFSSAKVLLQSKLESFQNLCSNLKLSFNSAKSSVIYFNNRFRKLDIQINSTPIPQVESIKYLGRYIASNNSPMKHVNHIVGDVKRSCAFLRLVNSIRTGINPSRALQLYRCFARPKLEYAISSFSNLSKKASSKIDSCVNDILRKSLGLLRSTPTNVVYHMAAELPSSYRYTLATAKEIGKAVTFELPLAEIIFEPDFNINTSVSKVFSKFVDIFSNMGSHSSSKLPCDKLFCDKDFFKGSIHSKKIANRCVIERLFAEKANLLKSKGFELIFTDGSVGMDGTGFAFYHPDSNHTDSFFFRTRFFRLLLLNCWQLKGLSILPSMAT